MSQFNEAADAIRRCANKYEVFVQAAAILEKAGSIENAEREAKEALIRADAARIKAEKERDVMEEALAKTAELFKEREAEADAITAAAKERADAALLEACEQAEESAAAILAKAKAEAEVILASSRAEHKRESDEVAAAVAFRNELQGENETLGQEVAAKQKTLDALNKSLDALKAKLA